MSEPNQLHAEDKRKPVPSEQTVSDSLILLYQVVNGIRTENDRLKKDLANEIVHRNENEMLKKEISHYKIIISELQRNDKKSNDVIIQTMNKNMQLAQENKKMKMKLNKETREVTERRLLDELTRSSYKILELNQQTKDLAIALEDKSNEITHLQKEVKTLSKNIPGEPNTEYSKKLASKLIDARYEKIELKKENEKFLVALADKAVEITRLKHEVETLNAKLDAAISKEELLQTISTMISEKQ